MNAAKKRVSGLMDEWEGRQRADRPWSEYPLGTKAFALMGGHWTRVEHGWKWMTNGGTFPRPGGDAFDVQLPKDTPA